MFSSLREESSYESLEEEEINDNYSFHSLQPRKYGARVARRKAIFESLSSSTDVSSTASSTSSESSPRLARKALNASCRNFLAFQSKEKASDMKASSYEDGCFDSADLKVCHTFHLSIDISIEMSFHHSCTMTILTTPETISDLFGRGLKTRMKSIKWLFNVCLCRCSNYWRFWVKNRPLWKRKMEMADLTWKKSPPQCKS